jgi:hypothetical protein
MNPAGTPCRGTPTPHSISLQKTMHVPAQSSAYGLLQRNPVTLHMRVVATAECPQAKAILQQFHRHIQGKHTSKSTSLTIITSFTVAVKEDSAYLEISNHPIRYDAHQMIAREALDVHQPPDKQRTTNSINRCATALEWTERTGRLAQPRRHWLPRAASATAAAGTVTSSSSHQVMHTLNNQWHHSEGFHVQSALPSKWPVHGKY